MINRKLSPPSAHLHRYINPERDSEEGALNVHGLSTEFLSDKHKFADVADEFLDFVRDAELIIHNAPFDVGFLNMELAKIGRGKITDYVSGVIDTLANAKELFPGKRNNLDALCDRYEVDRSARTLHGALIDCELLAEVYLCMTRGQDSLLIDFGGDDQSATNTLEASKTRQNQGPLKVIRASDAELAEHAAYLDALDKTVKGACVWRQYEPKPEAA
jgi:DNA polymerase-3 subunit epsilon